MILRMLVFIYIYIIYYCIDRKLAGEFKRNHVKISDKMMINFLNK